MRSQSGFTLIEMVAVIVILAIMAATALPRFINMSGDARLSALDGLAGALTSTRTLVKTKWIMANSGYLNTIDMGGGFLVSTVSFTNGPSSVDIMGIPTANTLGIWAALDNPNGFSSALVTGPAGRSGVAFWPNGVAVSNACYAFYDTSGLVTVNGSSVAGVAPTATDCL